MKLWIREETRTVYVIEASDLGPRFEATSCEEARREAVAREIAAVLYDTEVINDLDKARDVGRCLAKRPYKLAQWAAPGLDEEEGK